MHHGWAAKEFADLVSRHQAATTALTHSGTFAVQATVAGNSSSNNNKDGDSALSANGADHTTSGADDKAASSASSGGNNSGSSSSSALRALPLRITPTMWGAVDVAPLDELGAPPDAEEQEALKVLANQIEASDAASNPGGAAAAAAAASVNGSVGGGGGDSDPGLSSLHSFSPSLLNRLCFTDSDLRYRGAEERASEAIVENACRAAAEHVNASRHRMTKPVRNLLMPLHPDIPSAFKLRLDRDRIVTSATTVLTQDPLPSAGECLSFDIIKRLSDASMRTQAVSTDGMLGVPLINTLTAMRGFFARRIKELPRIQLRVLQRFVAATYHQVELGDSKKHAALLRGAKNAFVLLANEQDMVRSAAQRIAAYHDRLMTMQRRKDASHATSEAGTQPESAMLSPVVPSATADATHFELDMSMRVVEELRVDDFRSYLHAKNTDVRLNRKLERFVAQCEMLPLAKRFEMYTEAVNASIDGNISGWRPHTTASLLAEDLLHDPSLATQMFGGISAAGGVGDGLESTSTGSGAHAANVPTIEAFKSLPALMENRHAVQRHLTDLCNCFGLEPHVDGSDTHSFVFGVTRKASIVFQAQQRALSFLNERQLAAHIATLQADAAGTSGSAAAAAAAAASSSLHPAAGDNDSDFGFSKPRLRPNTGACSATLLFDGDGADLPAWLTAQRAAIAAVAPKPHPALEAELRFLAESNFQSVQNRWRDKAASGGGMLSTMIQTLSGAGGAGAAAAAADLHSSGGGTSASARHKQAIRTANQQQQHQLSGTIAAGVVKIDSTTTQRLFCVFLLRFVRIREVRRRILATLNFLASVERRLAIDCQTVMGASGLKQTNVPLAGQVPSASAVADTDPALFDDTTPNLDAATAASGGGGNISFDSLLHVAADASEQSQRWFNSGVGATLGDPAATVPNMAPGIASNRGSVPVGSLYLSPDDPLAPPDAYVDPSSAPSNPNAPSSAHGNVDDNTREFTWTVIDGTCCPLRTQLSARTPVIYKTALLAQQQLEVEAASIASYFVAQRSDAAFNKAHQEASSSLAGGGDGGDDAAGMLGSGEYHQHHGDGLAAKTSGAAAAAEALSSGSGGAGAANIDYLALLEDVLECEGWFAEAKRDVVASLFTAYTHTTDLETQSQLARQIMETMRKRPRVDLQDTSFAKSYSAEVIALEMQSRLLKEVLDHQMQTFRGVVTELGLNVTVQVPPAPAQTSQSRAATHSTTKDGSQHQQQHQDGYAAIGSGANVGGVPRHAGPSRIGMPFVLPWNEHTDGGPLPRYRPVPSATPTGTCFDIVSNTGSLCKVLPAAKAAMSCMAGRFPDLERDAAAQLQLEVTLWREMLDAWHVLDEEDRASRDMLQQKPGGAGAAEQPSVLSSSSATAGAGGSAAGGATALPLSVHWNLFDDPPAFDALVQEVGMSSPTFGGGKGGGGGGAAASAATKRGAAFVDHDDDDAGPSSSGLRRGKDGSGGSGAGGGKQQHNLSAADIMPLPTPSPVVLAYSAAIEAFNVRTELVAALHRTELLYNVHRRQAIMMGITIRKQQLDPIDFEARRAFAELDRSEQLQNRMDATGAGAPPLRGAADEGERVVLAVGLPVELLPRLAIAEFDLAMSRFDFSSETGMRRVLTSQLSDLHRALAMQVSTKNVAASVVGLNNAPLDLFVESVARKRWEAMALRVADSCTFMTNASSGQLLAASPAEAAEFGLRKLHWPALEKNDDPLEDRHIVQQLYVSLNTVKSTLRRAILADLNAHASADSTSVGIAKAASGALRIPAADLARRRAKLLKEILLEEYCSSCAVFCVKYGAILDAVWHAANIRWHAAQHPDVFHNIFNFGRMYDRVRQVPSSSSGADAASTTTSNAAAAALNMKKGVSFKDGGDGGAKKEDGPADVDDDDDEKNAGAGSADATATAAPAAGQGDRLQAVPVAFGGLLARNGLVDDYRYIPHPVQLLVTDFDPQQQSTSSVVYTLTPPEPRHSGSKSQRHFVESAILTSQADLLAHYHSLVKLSRNHSLMALSQRDALTVLHYACPAPENARTTDELREQRRRNRRYRIQAWNNLEAQWRAHMVVLQRDLSLFMQQQTSAAMALTQDGFVEAAGLLTFLTTAHRVMFLKFNVLARGTLEEMKSMDSMNAAAELNAAAALVVVQKSSSTASGAGGDGADGKDDGGADGTGKQQHDGKDGDPTSSKEHHQHQHQQQSGGGGGGGGGSFTAASQRALTASHAQSLAFRRELILLANDMLRHRDWQYRIDSFVDSEEFINRALVYRQARAAHPMVLFLQQLRGGLRRVFVAAKSNDSGGGKAEGRSSVFSRGVGASAANADDGQTRYVALPPCTWNYNNDVGLSITRAVQAMVGVPPTPLSESAAHMHHLLDSIHIALMLTRHARGMGSTVGGAISDCCTAFERPSLYGGDANSTAAPSLAWLACSQRVRSIWRREAEKFDAVSGSAGSILDVFDPNRQKISEGGDGASAAAAGGTIAGESLADAAFNAAANSAAGRDITVSAERALAGKAKAFSRGSDYAVSLRLLVDTVRRDQLRDACMILVRQEKMPAAGDPGAQRPAQQRQHPSAKHSSISRHYGNQQQHHHHLHHGSGSGKSVGRNNNSSAPHDVFSISTSASNHQAQLMVSLQGVSMATLHSISSEWTTRMMAKSRKWVERLDLLARETAMSLNSGEPMPSFVPPYVVQPVPALLRKLVEEAAEHAMYGTASTNAAAAAAAGGAGGAGGVAALTGGYNTYGATKPSDISSVVGFTGAGGAVVNSVTSNTNYLPALGGSNIGPGGTFSARDAHRRVVTGVMIAELHRMLLKRTSRELQSVVQLLEATTRMAEERSAAVAPESTDVKDRLAATAGSGLPSLDAGSEGSKAEIFADFASIILSRSSVVRDEFGPGGSSNPVITYQIPETALSLALTAASRRLSKWSHSRNVATSHYFSTLLGAQQRRISTLEGEVARLETQRDLDQKMVTRRVQATVTDQHFALLFELDHLSKETGALQHKLVACAQTVREAVTSEFEEKLSKLHQQLIVSQGQYRTFQRRLQEQLQNSLEGIKREAILSVTKMESAPLHMRRQAMKMAVVDSDVHALKRENSILRQTVLKAKLWFEVRLLRQRSDFEAKIHALETAMEAARSSFWTNRELAVQERDKLSMDLKDAMTALARAESEVDQLRRDLQMQVGNRRDVSHHKNQQDKLVRDMAQKIANLEQQRARLFAEAGALAAQQQQQQQQQASPANSAVHNNSSNNNTEVNPSPIGRSKSSLALGAGRRPARPPSTASDHAQNQHRNSTPLGAARRLHSASSGGGLSNNVPSSRDPQQQQHHHHQQAQQQGREDDDIVNSNLSAQVMLRQIKAQLDRERAMKHQAMARAEQLQRERDEARVVGGGGAAAAAGASSTAALWQRKYVEAASQVQHLSSELARLRTMMNQHQQQQQHAPALGNPLKTPLGEILTVGAVPTRPQ